jgi:membrane peptidoglycan carboxypeptidase
MPPASPSPPHPRHRLWRGVLIAGLGSLMASVALLVLVVAWYGPQLPSLDPVTTYQPRQPLQVFTADGVEIGQFGTERRQFTPIAQIPRLMQQAVLSVEDAALSRATAGSTCKGMARAVLAHAHRRAAPGRVHHHAAGGAHLLPGAALHAPSARSRRSCWRWSWRSRSVKDRSWSCT